MIIIYIISYIILAALLIKYIVTIFKAKKDGVFAIGYARMSWDWDNVNRYVLLAFIILNIVSEFNDIAYHEDMIKLFDGDTGMLTHHTALIANTKAWIAAYLFLLYMWFATLLNNIGLFTKNGVYFLGSFKLQEFTAERRGKRIAIMVGSKYEWRFSFRRTEKNMERFKGYFNILR